MLFQQNILQSVSITKWIDHAMKLNQWKSEKEDWQQVKKKTKKMVGGGGGELR